jgi:HEAT repeat protein
MRDMRYRCYVRYVRYYFFSLILFIFPVGIAQEKEEESDLQNLQNLQKTPLSELLEKLSSRNEDIVLEVLQELSQRKESALEAAPLIVELLNHRNEWVRITASETLSQLGSQVIPLLIQTTTSEISRVRRYAYQALGEFRKESEKILPALLLGLQDSRIETQITVTQILGKLKALAQEALPRLLAFAHADSPELRKEALIALAEIAPDHPEVFEVYFLQLQETDEDIQYLLGQFLERFQQKSQEKTQRLLKILPHIEDTYLQAKVIAALGQVAELEQLPLLLTYFQSPHEKIRYEALKAFHSLNGASQETLPLVLPFAQESYEPTRLLFPKVLSTFPGDPHLRLPALRNFIRDINPKVRYYTMEALGDFRPVSPLQLEYLHEGLKDIDLYTVHQAVLSLGKLGADAQSSAPLLLRFLHVAHGEMRFALIQTLTAIRPPDPTTTAFTSFLEKAYTQTQDPSLQLWSLYALLHLKNEPLEPLTQLLLSILEAEEEEQKRQAFILILELKEIPELLEKKIRHDFFTYEPALQEELRHSFKRLHKEDFPLHE